MRIGLPSDDMKTIAGHFGKTRGFLVFDAQGSDVAFAEYRSLDPSGPSCSCEGDHGESHHDRISRALADCDRVLAQGMGPGMHQSLIARGIDVRYTSESDPRRAIVLAAAEPATDATPNACSCSHH